VQGDLNAPVRAEDTMDGSFDVAVDDVDDVVGIDDVAAA
jgi:hypothetical protein